MNNYKTLYYLNSIGLEPIDFLKSFKYDYLKAGLKACRDYELIYYHCKVLKMPLKTYEKNGLIMAIVHNAIQEYEDMLADNRQMLQDQKEAKRVEKQRQNTTKKAFKVVFIFAILYLMFALGSCFACWMLL